MVDISCCIYCGRDTRASDGVCSHCRGGIDTVYADQRETRGRGQLDPRARNGSAMKFRRYRYHGDSVRDDL
jgi:hypothetical protein